MTMLPDNPERDPALSKAWREHSAEMPPGHLDAAIRAAARRAVGSVPRDAAAPEATSPQRWWMPLAAAATIGAVALGVLQTMPPDQPVTSPSVSDMPASSPASPPASSSAPSARDKLAPVAPPAPPALKEMPAQKPPRANAPMSTLNEKPSQEPPRAYEPSKQAPKVDAQRAAGNAGAPAGAMEAAPQPFPAETKREAADAAFSKERGGAVPGVATVQSAPPQSAAAPSPPPAPQFQGRPDAAAASRLQVPPVAHSPPAAPSPAAATPESARPAAPRDEMRQRSEMAQSPPSATGGVAPAKKSASTEKDSETKNAVVKDSGKAVDVDEWIARIRKLHGDGKLADAAKELNALRAAVPDADSRLPPELRAWAATVKR